MRFLPIIVVGVACFGAAACNANMTAPMQIERSAEPAVTQDADSGKRAAAEPVRFTADNAPFRFVRTTIAIRNGTRIFAQPAEVEGVDAFCNAVDFRDDHGMVWSGGSQELGAWRSDTGVIFYDVMQSAGYDLAGDPDQLFEIEDDTSRARFHVAGRIDRMKGNLCEEHHIWDARPLGNFAGEMSMDVTWAVLDTLSQETVYQTQTRGYHQTGRLSKDGITRIMHGAFADAAGILARDAGFQRTVAKSDAEAPTASERPLPAEPIFLARMPASDRSFQDIAEDRLAAAVTIIKGGGHGSGVVIAENGYILTNEHVVGGAEQVSVAFDTGVTVTGTVLRRHKARDIALVKVPMTGLTAAPIAERPPRIGADVFVVGTPLDTELDSTVTRGIFGGTKTMQGVGGPEMEWIRHDAAAFPGNSGGAVYDENGNVIGLIALGVGDRESLNFGVPIDSGLAFLNIRWRGAPGS